MTEEQQVKKPTVVEGMIVTSAITMGIIGWILLGSLALNVTSFFASFLFLWYWAGVEEAKFDRWLPTLVGAFTGLILALQIKYLPEAFGTAGLIVAILIVTLAVFVHIMDWVPVALNKATMLFLTVFAAPPILESINPIEVAIATAGGAIFFAGFVKLMQLAVEKKGQGSE